MRSKKVKKVPMKFHTLFLILSILLPLNLLYAQSEEDALTFSLLGAAAKQAGRYHEALSYDEEALKIWRELSNSKMMALILQGIGNTYHKLGQYEKALSSFERASRVSREPQNIVINLNGIGRVYRELGQYEKALSSFEEALKVSKEINMPEDENTQILLKNVSMNNIARAYSSLGQYEKALFYDEDVLKVWRELSISKKTVLIESDIRNEIGLKLEDIGYIYLYQKKYKEAEEKFLEAEKEYQWGDHPGLIDVYLVTGRYGEALKLLNETTLKWNTVDSYRINFYTRYGLALKGNGMLREASHELFKAVSISEEMRQQIRAKERVGFLGTRGPIQAYRGLVASLSERALKGETIEKEFVPYGKDLASNAFYFSEATKARTLLEAMAEAARKYEKTELPSEIEKKQEDLLNQLSAIESQWEETYKKGEEAFKALVEKKEGLKKELDSLILKLRKEYPRYAVLHYPRPIPAEELPLKEKEILLEYAISDDTTYLFKISKGGVDKVLRIPAGKKEIERLVKEFVLPLQHPDTREKFSPALGQRLYSLLLEDGLKGISSEKQIILVPDGILGSLPFEALVITPGKDLQGTVFVGDQWKISYYQSAAVLALNRLLRPSEAKKPLFAVGNPIYDKTDPRYTAYKQGKPQLTLLVQNSNQYGYRGLATRREWGKTTQDDQGASEVIYEPLLDTEAEVKAIASLFGIQPKPPDVLLNVLANETRLLKVPLKDYRRLHFATHADLPGKVQGIKEPFLLLGQVENQEGDDGFLTLTEVLNLKLDADLVVLSACVTGRGQVMEGEGVLNFARAFHHAGARSVVVSLWEVASEVTVEYMKLFYQHLKAGKSRAEALSLVRKEVKAKYPNPYFWAPFILHGEL